MFASTLLLLPALASLASAHFQIDYPVWRGDSFAANKSQYIFPCANVNQSASATNRTLWPLAGGSIELDLHHPWTYFAINLATGNDVNSFNVSLTPNLVNSTGNGTLCYPIPLPVGLNIPDGTNASIQVVTFGQSGSALYNCADITFSSKAPPAGDRCKTNGVTVAVVNQAGTPPTNSSSSTPGTSTTAAAPAATTSKPSAAGKSFQVEALSTLVLLAIGVSALI